jgi:hypothetical protein
MQKGAGGVWYFVFKRNKATSNGTSLIVNETMFFTKKYKKAKVPLAL